MQIIDTGMISQSAPGTDRANLTFPAVVCLVDGTLMATWHSGATKDGGDETIEVSRSSDHGKTWSTPERPFSIPALNGLRGTIKICYMTQIAPGRLIAAAMWVDRDPIRASCLIPTPRVVCRWRLSWLIPPTMEPSGHPGVRCPCRTISVPQA